MNYPGDNPQAAASSSGSSVGSGSDLPSHPLPPVRAVLVGPAEAAGAVLREACSLPAAPNPAFDRFAELVRAQLGVPVALVSLVSRHEQVLPGALGLPDSYQQQRRTPLTHSVCQHVVLTRRTLLLDDIRALPWLADSLAIPDLGVVAYAGAPLTNAANFVVGSLCAIDHAPRTWAAGDRRILEALAAECSAELARQEL